MIMILVIAGYAYGEWSSVYLSQDSLDTGQPPRYRYYFALKGVTRGGNRVTHARSDVKRWLKRCWWETANAPETGCARLGSVSVCVCSKN